MKRALKWWTVIMAVPVFVLFGLGAATRDARPPDAAPPATYVIVLWLFGVVLILVVAGVVRACRWAFRHIRTRGGDYAASNGTGVPVGTGADPRGRGRSASS